VHIPILRSGVVYESLEQVELTDYRDGSPLATMSLANEGLIRRDLRQARGNPLDDIPCAELLDICERAAVLFGEADLLLSPEAYLDALSATTGLPLALCQANMEKIQTVLRQMREVFAGLTGGLDPAVLDSCVGQLAGRPVSYYPLTQLLGAVLPSNSPGVHSIWLPAIAFKMPVALKPGREEPWTPYRIIQALIAAGCPAEAFSFYPTDHGGARCLLEGTGRAILFGDATTTAPYANNPRISLHGPGRSKVLFGEDLVDDWPAQLDLLVDSVARNGGRSCINASVIVVPRHADKIAAALAERLEQLPTDNLAAFTNPAVAESIHQRIEAALTPGQAVTEGPRLVTVGGPTYLRPTVLRLPDWTHPLANAEFLFPYVSVMETPQREMLEHIGPTLVVSALTDDAEFRTQLVRCPEIDRLNLGPLPTTHVAWDQPHEGNLFQFLYQRRAIAIA